MTLKHSLNYLVATFNNVVEVKTFKQLSIRKISFARGNAFFCKDTAFAYRFMMYIMSVHS